MDISYLSLASRKNELTDTSNLISVPGLSLANKDVFMIQSNICSTKLTQNGMLNELYTGSFTNFTKHVYLFFFYFNKSII